MKSYLTYPKKEFEEELKFYIKKGSEIIERSQVEQIKPHDFEGIEIEFMHWKEEVLELLKQRFDNPNNEYYLAFDKADLFHAESMDAAIRGENPSNINFRFRFFKGKSEKKVEALKSLHKKLKFIPISENIIVKEEKIENMSPNKIFISHSSLDKKIVEKIIDMLETIGVPSKSIFCSSFEGYGVKLGADFLDVIKKELDSNVLVLFVLSENFYSSIISLCEMGATWVKTNKHIPILIPPFNYEDIKGVIPTTHGMKINEKEKYNNLKEIVEEFISIEPLKVAVWERKRDNILKEVKLILDNNKTTEPISTDEHHLVEDNYYDNSDEIIKELSKKEWEDDFTMQLDYIERQKNAVEQLRNHNPIDISQEEFNTIRLKGRQEWKDDFVMQLDYEQRQIESLRRLKKI